VGVEGGEGFSSLPFLVQALAVDHDVSGSRRAMAGLADSQRGLFALSTTFAKATQAQMLDDWPSVVAGLGAELPKQQALGAVAREATARMLMPLLAYGYARTGRQAEADAVIGGTPLDCDTCVIARGRIAAAKGDWSGAERWFDMVVRRTPSIPFANTAWGEMLLAKGDPDRAIEKLAEAHRQSPHFADPIELWGEALMKAGDDAGAVGKFREVDQYAPRWGHNHLRWGQALARRGKAAEAQAQFQAAAGMDLSAADRAELASVTKARSAPV
jgi:tetratricopeptide (TPR) repeat protein